MAESQQAEPRIDLDTTRLESPPPSAPQQQDSSGATEQQKCSVCLEEMVTGVSVGRRMPLYITECGHQYHYECIAKSCARRGGTCPLCRADIWAPPPPDKPSRTKQRAKVVVGAPGRSQAPPQIDGWEWLPQTRQVKGDVRGYPGHEDGSPITTSAISTADVHWLAPGVLGAVTATSSSGSRYRLGSPSPSFVERMAQWPMAGVPEWLITAVAVLPLPYPCTDAAN